MEALYSMPTGGEVRLRRRPVLASWDDQEHPHQKRLAAYLDELERDLHWGPRAGAHLSLALRVGLPREQPLDRGGHDLDNYLFPIANRLGHVRFDAVFAGKVHDGHSSITVQPSARSDDLPTAPDVVAQLTASATSIDWKEQLYHACRRQTSGPVPPGPVAVQVRLTVSRQRNWSALWKPALDALGPILGVPDPTRPYRAADDRITVLGLHRRLDDTVGHRVGVEIWCRGARRPPGEDD